MAYPTIEGSIYGSGVSWASSHSITLPTSIQKDEYIIGFVGAEEGSHTIYSSSGNFYISSTVSDPYADCHMSCFFGKALGGGSDNITINFYTSNIPSWIVYRISGHGMLSNLDFNFNFDVSVSTSNFNSPNMAVLDSGDKLWINAVTYNRRVTNFGAPSGFIGLIHNEDIDGTVGDGHVGIATSYVESSFNSITAGQWTNDLGFTQSAVAIIVRIKPGSLPEPSSLGIGIIMPSNRIGIN